MQLEQLNGEIERKDEELRVVDGKIEEELRKEARNQDLVTHLNERRERLAEERKDLNAQRKILEEKLPGAAAGPGPGSAGAGGAAAGPNKDVVMTAFIRAMQTAKLEPVGSGMSLLSLGPNVYFPDDTDERRSTLLVRDFYAKLLERMKGGRAWLLTGVPGTGKSWWIWYAMFELLQEVEPPAIVWQSFKKGTRRVLFKDGAAYVGDSSAFIEDLQLDSTWFFVDGMLPEWVVARTVMVCSPKRSIYKDWLKGRSSIQLTMPLWTWPELEMCWQHLYQDKGLSLERVKCNFNLWYGGVPRLVLEDPARRSDESLDGDIARSAIKATSIEQVERAIGGGYDAGSEASHRVIHQNGDRSTFCSSTYNFATSTVAAQFINEVSSHSVQARVLAELAGPSSSLASSRGQIFEAQAHKTLLSGGCFEFRYLDVPCNKSRSKLGRPSAAYLAAKKAALAAAATASAGGAGGAAAGQPLQLQLPSYGTAVLFTPGEGKGIGGFSSAAKACATPSYLQPAGSAHPVIDACIYPNQLLQCTVTPDRNSIDEELLEQHLQCLPDQPKYFLDYVVPADKYDSFQVPDLRRKSERVRKTLVRVVKVNCALRPVPRQLSAASLQRARVAVARQVL
ncbi:hypothetical protein HXX76_005274 [Chlamydomonas incerta]|uniref:Uncharacterized protein n=1 Tax=Chlamydomonas incerta TaxID=51695 RepID=A0A835T4K2_CHLIN|nr:hypothetical protein HXX76_005274 [Chlamydomonas incerta]|eukprot:KAG2438729.1 hypothetical protein HXX76_005274 [Chlamydomonas incerta]